MTKVLWCTCAHAYQDERYGAQMRVHNALKSDSKSGQTWRCTVCSRERGDK